MKIYIAAVFSALGVLASPTSASLPVLPATDGLYIGTVDEAGTFSWLSYGTADVAAPDVAARAPVPTPAPLTGAFCNDFRAGTVADINAAVEALVDACHDTYFSKAIALQRGGVVVYGCDYSTVGQRCNGFSIAPFFKSIGEVCTLGRAGWYQEAEWKASYGYTRAGVGFC
ncbi:hypothetical protein LMH87_000102 [Akanthomyces muscarius]|uniref:Uncharacterized protein n=1 Tax=Akanthomyces muscarius TaxID=2231603 RepID=A0A9W8QEN0_AKAMU|nr:hypothetical protein LMH87_000102 [Akanthomyces muscarius]KAJ4154826.1 hypothetical protein LMH87_000102 [Akanthomyces muscarius]